jgi:riboflavin synthase
LREELAALAGEGVQSLLLEGGPTLATAFLADGLVDRLLVFVAPVIAGAGPPMTGLCLNRSTSASPSSSESESTCSSLAAARGVRHRGSLEPCSRGSCARWVASSRRGDGEGLTLVVEAPRTAAGTAVGDSVAIGGVCLTAETVDGDDPLPRGARDAAPDDARRAAAGRAVNVEPALRAGEPLGGHSSRGTSTASARRARSRRGRRARVSIGAAGAPAYCVEKGSITVDGVSLTVASSTAPVLDRASCRTRLGRDHARAAPARGSPCEPQVDVLAKYVERLDLARR